MANASVLGCGRWGSFIAWYLDYCGHNVLLYGRDGSKSYGSLLRERTNGLVTLRESVRLTNRLSDALGSEIIVISIPSQKLAGLIAELSAQNPRGKTFVLCMKGIEVSSLRRLSEIASSGLDPSNRVAVWLGPGHVQEFLKGVPNCMVIDSKSDSAKTELVEVFSSELIRFYYGTDLIGNEIGAAAKNVIGIAAGILDGLGASSLKGALMSRGTREIARLISALGGSELSAYGLCHLGDYEATVFSEYSHNRRFGMCVVQGEVYDKLAEGYYTVRALLGLGDKYGAELPISSAVYGILYEGMNAREMLDILFSRSLKSEF